MKYRILATGGFICSVAPYEYFFSSVERNVAQFENVESADFVADLFRGNEVEGVDYLVVEV